MENYQEHCHNLTRIPTIIFSGNARDFYYDFYCEKTGKICIGNSRHWIKKNSTLKLNFVEACLNRIEDLTIENIF